MRRGGTLVSYVCLAGIAHAQPVDVGAGARAGSSEWVAPTHHAMPGGLNVADAVALPAGIAAVELTSGVGYRRGLLADSHRLVRASGEVAVAFGVLDALTLAFAVAGYYDRHDGFPSGPLSGCGAMCESGWVGKPHLYARFAKPSTALAFGAQLDVWVPGDVAPSMKLRAASIEARGLVSRSFGRARLSMDAGFHLDNSAKSIDYVAMLSVPDRVSFGISNYNALLFGARIAQPFGSRARLAAETSVVAFVGDATQGTAELREGRFLVRAGVVAEVRIDARWSGVAFVEGIKGPGVLASQATGGEIPIIPYEPMIVGGIGVASRFGDRGTSAPLASRPPPCWDTAAGCATDEHPLNGKLAGTVVDEDGAPVPGAKVTVLGKTFGGSATATTKEDGTYTIENIRVGKRMTTPTKAGPKVNDELEVELEVKVEIEGYEPRTSKVALPKPGTNAAPAVALPKALPPGQIRGVVRNLRGKPIANATITIAPGGRVANSGPDGRFAIDLAPGAYRITVTAKGFSDQELAVTIDPNGVALKELVLRE